MKEDLAISKNGLMSLFEENNRLKRELDLAQTGSSSSSKPLDDVSFHRNSIAIVICLRSNTLYLVLSDKC